MPTFSERALTKPEKEVLALIHSIVIRTLKAQYNYENTIRVLHNITSRERMRAQRIRQEKEPAENVPDPQRQLDTAPVAETPAPTAPERDSIPVETSTMES